MNKIKLIWNKICDIFTNLKFKEMSKKVLKYKISSATVRKANSALVRNGISEKTRSSYDGDINIQYQTKNGIVKKSFSNSDIKQAYEKALLSYVQKV